MEQRDKKKFAALMAAMAEVFDRGAEISALKMDLYFKALERYPIDHISLAISNLIQGRVFPSLPKPAEIIQEIQGKAENRATEAWLLALEGIRRVGNYQSVKFVDPVIHSVIQAMGGWPRFCDGEAKDEKWKQKEFERLYTVIAERPGKHPQYLPGDHELQNAALGHEQKQEIVQIGFEQEKIRLIK
ncbi:MAG TPA: DUF6475 domain-containing protein [Candidatus Omnitrophota bacterium]|nr:DUF6475 domain-containing protein [Candidatus Omnitrophota bacterium]